MSTTDDNVVPLRPSWQEQVIETLEQRNPVNLGSAEVVAINSESDNMTFYYVLCFDNGNITCTCRGFRYRDKCKHVEQVEGMDL